MINNDYEKESKAIYEMYKMKLYEYTKANPSKLELKEKQPSPIRPYSFMWCDYPPNIAPYNCISNYPSCPISNNNDKDKFKIHSIKKACRTDGTAYGIKYNYCEVCGYCVYYRWDDY